MNDNRSISELLRDLNIGANGRWFVIILAAVAIAIGATKIAVLLAATLGVAVLIEQVGNTMTRLYLVMCLYAATAALAILLLVIA